MPGDNFRDCPNNQPAENETEQAQLQQESQQTQYSEHQQKTQDQPTNIAQHQNNKDSTTNIDQLIESTITASNNSHQRLTQRQLKRINRNARTYRSNYIHNLSNGPWGDKLCNKEEDTFRIAYQNINNLQTSHHADTKMEQGKDWLMKHEIDIIGWAEVGIAWQKCKSDHKLYHRFKDMRWRQFKYATSNNKREAHSVRQFGGTSTIALNECASRVTSTGADETGLGRWSWILLEGKSNIKVRIITAYNPCKTSHNRPATVYAQHKRYLLSKNKSTCPRTQFQIDLCNQIRQRQQNNNRIVLMIDLNENMSRTNGPLLQAIIHDIGLIDPIKLRHHSLPPPVTQNRGSCQIDGIFTSPELRNILRGGWTAFGDGIGDHRAGYIDIKVNDIIGVHKLDIVPRNARRLTCDDPRTIQRYNNYLKKHAKEQNLLTRSLTLQQEATFPPSEAQIQELDDIHDQREKNCQGSREKMPKIQIRRRCLCP